MRRWTTLLILLLAPRAHAQSNFESALLGGRTTLMGGAAVATGSDEATAFINPAGITRVPGTSFSFSTVAIHLASRHIENAVDPNQNLGVDHPDTGKLRLRFIPNTFCLFLNGPPKDDFSHRSRHKYSLCAAATERERLAFSQNRFDAAEGQFKGTSQSTSAEFVKSSVALSWGIELDRRTSLGATFRVDNSRYQDHSGSVDFAGDGGYGLYQSLSMSREAWSWDTSVTVGITSNISRVVTLGAALTTPSQHLLGKYTSQTLIALRSPQGYGVVQDDGDFRYNNPGSLRLGLGFSWPKLTIEVNGTFYGPQQQRARANFDRRLVAFDENSTTATESGRASVTEKGKPVTNLSVGAEYFLTPDFSVLGGAGTDFSGLYDRENQAPGDMLFRQSRDAAFASLGMTSYGRRGRLLLGVQGQYSWGKVLVADPSLALPQFVALDQSYWSLAFVISGQINLSTVFEAAEKAVAPIAEQMSGSRSPDKEERKK